MVGRDDRRHPESPDPATSSPSKEQSPHSYKTIKNPSNADHNEKKKRRGKKRGRVKFAEPLTKQKYYNPKKSPQEQFDLDNNDEMTLTNLEPPLSLVAQMDIAAKKLNVRESTHKDSDLQSNKSIANKDNKDK